MQPANSKLKILGSGLSGLVGKSLVMKLQEKYFIVQLVRSSTKRGMEVATKQVSWSPPDLGVWVDEFEGAYAVINLSGENIAGKRWTLKQKEELLKSRIHTTRALVQAISKVKNKPKVLINASAIGFYGARGDQRLTEEAEKGSGFLPRLCAEWEEEALKAKECGVRVVLLRTGIVLARENGALAKMVPPFKMFIGGPLGSGRQYMSWIHLDDEVDAIIKSLDDERMAGPVNLTAPNAVTMKQFSQELAKTLKRPCGPAVPAPLLKLLLGEMADMLLTGQNVYPKRLLDANFRFKFDALTPALQDLLGPQKRLDRL